MLVTKLALAPKAWTSAIKDHFSTVFYYHIIEKREGLQHLRLSWFHFGNCLVQGCFFTLVFVKLWEVLNTLLNSLLSVVFSLRNCQSRGWASNPHQGRNLPQDFCSSYIFPLFPSSPVCWLPSSASSPGPGLHWPNTVPLPVWVLLCGMTSPSNLQ